VNERAKIHGDLREACVAEAMRIIRDVGIEELSLREVARRLGVSHQAPYRHFPSRDHILAEIVDRCFRDFDAWLAQTPRTDDPMADLDAMGVLYLRYAAEHPLEYRLMFGAKLPDAAAHPEMLERGCGAYDQLRAVLGRIFGLPPDSEPVTLDAMFVWAAMHGIASIFETDAMSGLGVTPEVQARVSAHVRRRIRDALSTGLGDPAPGG
jgi:AcrR family transcriptional regulator